MIEVEMASGFKTKVDADPDKFDDWILRMIWIVDVNGVKLNPMHIVAYSANM